ncbi:grpE [Verticillium alfalfae VaMs.102]|uniref:GrpE protein homolog n=1 Tax=Verticillium alfalfae (strain VaMs.102 / ATCC MYA-4576 / FGSC 10136) TaxID=526221 RepID=C9SKT5_VERA1|nr:grpE [Verticillium alfalfae VaMs.102]EEY19303.1 grpE [Verticillium alfalfae VaMs.102]
MLRKVITSGARATRSAARAPAASQALLRPQFQQTQTFAPAFRLRAAQPAVSRWYSSEPDSKADAKAKEGDAAAPESANPELDALKKQLEAKEKEALDWKDKCLRSVADFRNLQDRTTREMKSARDFAIQKFAKDLVDSIDNLDRALGMVPESKLSPAADASEAAKDLANLHEGLRMTETVLMNTLEKHGLERFSPEADKFNPNEHEATFMTPQPGKEDNTVFHVQSKGFKLNGRVLRAAKVGVVKNQ